MTLSRSLLLPLAAAVARRRAGPRSVAPADPAAAARVRGHIEFLADDLLEGRGTGTRGHEIAAAYVASQFRALGLQPAGENGGWYQWVPLRRARLVEGKPQHHAVDRRRLRRRSANMSSACARA